MDAEAPLLRRVDQEQPAERPERLPAEVGRALLIDQGDPLAGRGELMGGGQTGEAGADDDHVRIHDSEMYRMHDRIG